MAVGGLVLPQEPPEVKKKPLHRTYVYPRHAVSEWKWQNLMAKCPTKVRSSPASHFLPSLLTLSQQDHAPCWKPQARASQSLSEGSLMVLAATSSTRHTPSRLRPGNRRTREPWQTTRVINKEERGEKTALRADQGFAANANVNCAPGRWQFLLQL